MREDTRSIISSGRISDGKTGKLVRELSLEELTVQACDVGY